ncbi:MAG: hypothetical protein Q8P17_04675, partial [bacterium]|nr:hypothetical protein [bacterium]
IIGSKLHAPCPMRLPLCPLHRDNSLDVKVKIQDATPLPETNQTNEIDAMRPVDAIGQQRMSNITPDPRDAIG